MLSCLLNYLLSVFLLASIAADTKADTKTDTRIAEFQRTLPKSYQIESIEVPEDWGNPQSKKIQIFYYGDLDEIRNGTKRIPVVFFNGGPWADSHATGMNLGRLKQAESFAFVFIDQRGTGFSKGTELSLEKMKNYGSRAIVRDAEGIREKLLGRNGKWRIWGQSYGSLIVQRYIETAPENIEAAFAHGFAPSSDSVMWQVMRLRSQKKMATEYLKKYPKDEARIRKIQSALPKNKCFGGTGSLQICGPAVLDYSYGLLAYPTMWLALHELLVSWAPSSGLDLKEITASVSTQILRKSLLDAAAGDALDMMEVTPGWHVKPLCQQAQSILASAGERPEEWLVNECRYKLALQNVWTDQVIRLKISDPLKAENIRVQLDRNPGLKFYLYASQLDSVVPPETFTEATGIYQDRVIFRLLPHSGHEGYRSEAQVWQDLLNP